MPDGGLLAEIGGGLPAVVIGTLGGTVGILALYIRSLHAQLEARDDEMIELLKEQNRSDRLSHEKNIADMRAMMASNADAMAALKNATDVFTQLSSRTK